MKKDELEKLGFALSDLLPRLEMIQHASEVITVLNNDAAIQEQLIQLVDKVETLENMGVLL